MSMNKDDDEFEKLISNETWKGEQVDSVTLPRWLVAVFCFSVPTWMLSSFGSSNPDGNPISAMIFGLIVGGAFYYYIRHRVIFKSLLNSEKPALQALQDYQASKKAQTMPSVAEGTLLSEDENNLWSDIIAKFQSEDDNKKK